MRCAQCRHVAETAYTAMARKAGNSTVVVIPSTIRRFHGIEPGDEVDVWISKSGEGD